MISRLRPFISMLLLLALLGQTALVYARAEQTLSQQQGSLARLIQLDLCSHAGNRAPSEEVPLPCDQCLTSCCSAYLSSAAPQLATAPSSSRPTTQALRALLTPTDTAWQRPQARAPPLNT